MFIFAKILNVLLDYEPSLSKRFDRSSLQEVFCKQSSIANQITGLFVKYMSKETPAQVFSIEFCENT